MKIKNFLKDKILQITLILFGLVTIEIFLLAYTTDNFIKLYIPITILSLYLISIFVEYMRKKKFYKTIYEVIDELDEKYLISEVVDTPNFFDGKILMEIIKQLDKSMIENVNKYKYLMEDYKEYIEMWIHEIKLPIASGKMIVENNKTEATKSINEELDKIENYTEQALYYARSNTVEKDYYIRKCNLKELVNEAIRKNKKTLISEKISINSHDLDKTVNTDSKWLTFILNQIIQNSIKYRNKASKSEIEFYAEEGKENCILYIQDNGIGIEKSEVSRVFEKGFTGTNGRTTNKKSTGIGLYLCKKLSTKLGLGIELESTKKEGTLVKIVFPNNSYLNIKS